ncbi:MAG TPA: hypothetical protein VGB45_09975 [Abditibacterium sp.]|jgi:hypothetical protein
MFATRSTLEAMAEHFESAVCPEEVFGALPGEARAQFAALKALQRELTRTCHPDLALPADKALATQLFQSLCQWEGVARLKIEDGTYGDFLPYRAPEAPYQPVELEVRGQKLKLTGLIAEGTFAGVHHAEMEGETAERVTFAKYARDARDNDLLEREYLVLKGFQHAHPDGAAEEFFQKQRVYVPAPRTSFSLLDETGAKHRTNVLSVPAGDCYTAEVLRRDKFPDGIEPKHVWWIFRRLLLTLWMAHLKGYVHGAVTPDHLLIFPQAHGLVLLDWTCAAKIGEEHVPALNPTFEAFYPPEIARKEVAFPATDLFMAASTAIYMLGSDPARRQIPRTVPAALAQALLDCLHPNPAQRPQDAEIFHNEFGALLGHRVYSQMFVP